MPIILQKKWHLYLGGNQQGFTWSEDLLNKKESMAGSVNLANYI